ncbi:MAG TPA: 2-C-methyl-D-erythritol 4-phosphate cytidylyltransferase, partial [Draconibacterium sp.]|nr:2-C-methyl-D-erythritol 4-phosphate cytidylyltransferase [Draconibacterium sp.]
MKKFALIVAGGSGKRMNLNEPKQFLQLNGKPLLFRTMEAFTDFDTKIHFVVVLPELQIERWNVLCSKFQLNVKHILVAGGATRFHSVKKGLDAINEEGIVFIHDGVRPLVSVRTIKNCYQTALEKGNALPVVKPSESIRKIDNGKSRAVDRSKYVLVQTPQTFKV